MNRERRRLLAAGAGAALAGAVFVKHALAQAPEQLVRLTARKFAFIPEEITLKTGVPAVLEIVSPEAVMGFSAPDFNVRTDLIPGQTARVRLLPHRVGTFEFLCDVFCGDGHEGMPGTIRVIA